MFYPEAGLLRIRIAKIRGNPKQDGLRRPRTGVCEGDSELLKIGRRDRPNCVWHPDHSLTKQCSVNIDRAARRERICRIKRRQDLCDLAKTIDLVQRARDIIDRTNYRPVKYAIAAPNNCLFITARVP